MSGRDDDLVGIPLHATGLSPDADGSPWSFRLIAFVRLLAVVHFAKGLWHWASLIGVGGSGDPFAGVSTTWRIATVFFAVADLVAAVGLWLGAAWGVVIWLLAAIIQIVVGSLALDVSGGHWALSAVETAAMLGYVWLSLKSRREAAA